MVRFLETWRVCVYVGRELGCACDLGEIACFRGLRNMERFRIQGVVRFEEKFVDSWKYIDIATF